MADPGAFLVALGLWALVWGGLSYWIAARRAYESGGRVSAAFFGALLGVLGFLLVVATFRDRHPVCPYCLSKMAVGASACAHCGRAVVSPPGLPDESAPVRDGYACPACGCLLNVGDTRCGRCFYELGGPARG